MHAKYKFQNFDLYCNHLCSKSRIFMNLIEHINLYSHSKKSRVYFGCGYKVISRKPKFSWF